MFDNGYQSNSLPVEEKNNRPGPEHRRFSPVVIAKIRGQPLPELTPDYVIYAKRDQNEYVPAAKPKQTKKSNKKVMNDFAIEATPQTERIKESKAPEGIQHTKKYGLFKFLPTNRPVDRKHVNSLARAIKKKNLLHLNPIVVNGRMEVIDGQHRLEAAKLLKISIHYAQDAEVSQDDIAGMNSNKKNWGMMDYINFYAEKGIQSYAEFRTLCKLHTNILPSTLHSICTTEKRAYKEGVLTCDIEKAEQFIEYIKGYSKHTDLAFSGRFIDAVLFLHRSGEYDHERMMVKLQNNPGLIVPCANVKQYAQILQGIYNRGVHEKNIVIFVKR